MQKSTTAQLETQKRFYQLAYSHIDKALDLDHQLERGENVDIEKVKQLYIQGLDEIRKGLELEFGSHEWSARNLEVNLRQQAQILERKMKATKQKVEERLYILQKRATQQSSLSTASSSNKGSEPVKMPANIDPKIGNWILNEILVSKPDVTWNDVAGLDAAKKLLQELVILPAMRPDLYTGLRSPSKGVLLFGPPGTGKSLLAKAVAHECNANFFALSASSLVSKYLGMNLFRALKKVKVRRW